MQAKPITTNTNKQKHPPPYLAIYKHNIDQINKDVFSFLHSFLAEEWSNIFAFIVKYLLCYQMYLLLADGDRWRTRSNKTLQKHLFTENYA